MGGGIAVSPDRSNKARGIDAIDALDAHIVNAAAP